MWLARQFHVVLVCDRFYPSLSLLSPSHTHTHTHTRTDKALQVHGRTPSFYDIQLPPEKGLESNDGGRPKSAVLKIVSEPLLLRSSIGSATAASLRDNGYVGEHPSPSPASVRHSILSVESNPKEAVKKSLSREEVSLVKMLELHSYTIPSFSTITVKLRQVEVCRQGVTLDAFCKESPSLSSISLTLPKKVAINEFCIIPVSSGTSNNRLWVFYNMCV